MRKLFYLTPILLLFSCNRSIDLDSYNANDTFKVSNSDILSYIHDIKGIGTDTKSLESVNILPIIHKGDTVMYIANYENGWDVLSADRRAPVVLMSCDAGNLTESELYQNISQTEYVENVKDAIWNLSKSSDPEELTLDDSWNNVIPTAMSDDTWTDWYITGSTTITDTLNNKNHILATHWGQSGKWNNKTPYTNSQLSNHCPTGCVMVGGSQVLYYLHNKLGVPLNTFGDCTCTAYIPDGEQAISLNDNNTLFNTSSYNSNYWGLMPMSQSDNVPQSYFDYVSALMVRIGYLVGAQYKANATSAFTYNLLPVFRTEYSISGLRKDTLDIDLIRVELLQKDMPCIFAIGKTSGGGHCVVVDGYRRIGTFRRIFYQRHNNSGQINRKEERVLESEQNFFAINWGWDGTADVDSTTGSTIWYNAATIDWRGYNVFKYMLYGFEAI